MTQWQYDAIRKCIISGMPAAVQELIDAFDKAVVALNEKALAEKEKQEVKAPKECNAKG